MQRPDPLSALLMVASTAVVLAYLFVMVPDTPFTNGPAAHAFAAPVSGDPSSSPRGQMITISAGLIIGMMMVAGFALLPVPGQTGGVFALGIAPPLAFLLFGSGTVYSAPLATLLLTGIAIILAFCLYFSALLRASIIWLSASGLAIMVATAFAPIIWLMVPLMAGIAYMVVGDKNTGHALGTLALLATPALMMTACLFYLSGVLGFDSLLSSQWTSLQHWAAHPPTFDTLLVAGRGALPYFFLAPFLVFSFARPGWRSRLVVMIAFVFAIIISILFSSLLGAAEIGGLAILSMQSALFLALHERQASR
ncbi:MAG: hypothetical protein AAFY83_00550 [Pseudomonadota bacterium]